MKKRDQGGSMPPIEEKRETNPEFHTERGVLARLKLEIEPSDFVWHPSRSLFAVLIEDTILIYEFHADTHHIEGVTTKKKPEQVAQVDGICWSQNGGHINLKTGDRVVGISLDDNQIVDNTWSTGSDTDYSGRFKIIKRGKSLEILGEGNSLLEIEKYGAEFVELKSRPDIQAFFEEFVKNRPQRPKSFVPNPELLREYVGRWQKEFLEFPIERENFVVFLDFLYREQISYDDYIVKFELQKSRGYIPNFVDETGLVIIPLIANPEIYQHYDQKDNLWDALGLPPYDSDQEQTLLMREFDNMLWNNKSQREHTEKVKSVIADLLDCAVDDPMVDAYELRFPYFSEHVRAYIQKNNTGIARDFSLGGRFFESFDICTMSVENERIEQDDESKKTVAWFRVGHQDRESFYNTYSRIKTYMVLVRKRVIES